MTSDLSTTIQQVLMLAFVLGLLFGLIGQKTHFCTMGAVADIVNMGNWDRMRMWLLAIGVAILGAGALHGAGLIDLDQSIYRTPRLTWLSHLLGGLCFGVGMVLASGCGAKSLIRLGAGSLKSLVVCVVMGLVAYMTMRGLLAVGRVRFLDTVAVNLPSGQDLPSLLQAAGLSSDIAQALAVWGLGGGLLAFCLLRRSFWTVDNLLGGLGSGLIVVAGWYVSGHVGYLAEHPDTLQPAFLATNSGRMESLTFVASLAYTLDLLMFWSDTSRGLSLAVALGAGVMAGGALWALLTGHFRWQGFSNLEDTANHLIGAALMGFGGVLAMGCSVGQGLTGVSTLALGSLLTFAAIVAGATLTLKVQYWRLMRED